MAKQDHFRFLDLPAELRNTVYELIFETTDVHISLNGYFHAPPSILRTSSSIYQEAVLLYYHHTTFTFWQGPSLLHWYGFLPGKFRDAITKLRYCPPGLSDPVEQIYNKLHLHEGHLATASKPLKPGVLKAQVITRTGEVTRTDNLRSYVEAQIRYLVNSTTFLMDMSQLY